MQPKTIFEAEQVILKMRADGPLGTDLASSDPDFDWVPSEGPTIYLSGQFTAEMLVAIATWIEHYGVQTS